MEPKKPMDEKWVLWQRNVVNKYKDFSNEEIKDDLQKNATPAAVLMSQLEHDFNISSVIRNANFFGIIDVFYFGRKHFDARGACGTVHYSNINFLRSMDQVKALKEKYVFVGLENNVAGTQLLKDFVWPANSLIVVGEEKDGIPAEVVELLDFTVEIPARGSVRSINASAAFACAAFDYSSKLGV